jgi:Big-like domain-containing protein
MEACLRKRARRGFGLLPILGFSLVVASCGNGAQDPNNELPFGHIDAPVGGVTVPAGPLEVNGWALDDSAVKAIRIYVDNHFKAATTVDSNRPDLAGPYPQYVHGTSLHGWKAQVDIPSAPGSHTILAQAVDDAGATRDVMAVSVTVR